MLLVVILLVAVSPACARTQQQGIIIVGLGNWRRCRRGTRGQAQETATAASTRTRIPFALAKMQCVALTGRRLRACRSRQV
uniref:RH03148p1 n=1 Tax=Drosophila melanogaster TaxID=7227 RepID=G2J642_DROME|nr:RH03148p1 [Drosophila melanogaster]